MMVNRARIQAIERLAGVAAAVPERFIFFERRAIRN